MASILSRPQCVNVNWTLDKFKWNSKQVADISNKKNTYEHIFVVPALMYQPMSFLQTLDVKEAV